MRIKITQPGIYASNGQEIAVGTEMDVKSEPTAWAGRYETIKGGTAGKTTATNPDNRTDAEKTKTDLESRTVPQLKDMAANENPPIDLNGANTKGEIIERITRARATPPAPAAEQ